MNGEAHEPEAVSRPIETPRTSTSDNATQYAELSNFAEEEEAVQSRSIESENGIGDTCEAVNESIDDASTLEPNQAPEAVREREKAPRKIGGRRTPRRARTKSPDNGINSTFIPKPELLCREVASRWEWELILSVPQELNAERVVHNGIELEATDNCEYSLSSFSGIVRAEYANQDADIVSLDENTPLIFKLRTNWQGEGRRTKSITRGCFIVIAPRKWTRKGIPPAGPESCVDANYTAHFFSREQDDQTSDIGGFKESSVSLAQSGLVLEGKRVHDDSDEGELFVGDSPTLQLGPGILWARVGEEAPKGWKGENFKPSEKALGDIIGRRQGRFFIRVYDESISLVDSGDFRYCPKLQDIRVDGESYSENLLLAPPSGGHSPATLRFVVAQDSTIRPALKTPNPYVTVEHDYSVTVSQHPGGDETTWSLDPGGNMDVVIRLPRVWWRMTYPDGTTDNWCDNAIGMSRDEFRSKSDAEIEVRVPSTVKNVSAGFGYDKDSEQSFYSERGEDKLFRVRLPLDAFVDYKDIDEPLTDDVYLNARLCGTEIGLIHIMPDTPLEATLLNKPSAYVKRSDGSLRSGKGFSHGELHAAGLTSDEAWRLSVPVDRRRHSVHNINVDSLNEVKGSA